LAAGLLPDPLGELICFPDSLVAMGAYFYVGGREGGRKEGLFLRDRGKEGKGKGWKRREMSGNEEALFISGQLGLLS